jgi:2-amino-4-hydroxy-6-hydroxymethyldihydropteridine diphosphokinase
MNRVFLGIGSNIQDRLYYLKGAILELQQHKLKIYNYSSIYVTDPVGYAAQDPFLNMVVEVYTNHTPEEMLSIVQDVEQSFGRNREIKWGPRTLDLDILLYNQENIETEDLIVPHPRMHERGFVIVPLCEMDEALIVNGRKVIDIYHELTDREGVQLWKRRSGEDVFGLFES